MSVNEPDPRPAGDSEMDVGGGRGGACSACGCFYRPCGHAAHVRQARSVGRTEQLARRHNEGAGPHLRRQLSACAADPVRVRASWPRGKTVGLAGRR